MNSPSKLPVAGRWRRWFRWASGVTLLALTPKCVLCAAAYLGLGAMLGLTGPELCGTSPATVPTWLPPAAALGLLAAVLVGRRLSRRAHGTG